MILIQKKTCVPSLKEIFMKMEKDIQSKKMSEKQ